MKYTWENMFDFYTFYGSDEYSNRIAFTKRMQEIGVPEEEACLMWQAFDMATERVWEYIYDKKIKF